MLRRSAVLGKTGDVPPGPTLNVCVFTPVKESAPRNPVPHVGVPTSARFAFEPAEPEFAALLPAFSFRPQ